MTQKEFMLIEERLWSISSCSRRTDGGYTVETRTLQVKGGIWENTRYTYNGHITGRRVRCMKNNGEEITDIMYDVRKWNLSEYNTVLGRTLLDKMLKKVKAITFQESPPWQRAE